MTEEPTETSPQSGQQGHSDRYQKGQQIHPGQYQREQQNHSDQCQQEQQSHSGQSQREQQSHSGQSQREQQIHPGQNQREQQSHSGQYQREQQGHPGHGRQDGSRQEQHRQERKHQDRSRQERSHHGRRAAAIIVLLFCCLAGMGGGILLSRRGSTTKKEGLVYEANIISGDIPGKSREERQRELNSIVEEGMLAMSMNVTPSGSLSGSGRAINWLIENPSNQGKLIRVEITRDDTGEKIYETGAIPPGNYVESAPLDVPLPAGQYSCTAVFFAYQMESEELMGQAAVEVTLTLQE